MTQNITGRWVTEPGSKAFLDFADGGALSGSDGANRISTSWQADGGEAVVDAFLTTQMAAPGMTPWVGRIHRATVDGDTLIVLDHAGNRLGEMIRDTGGEK